MKFVRRLPDINEMREKYSLSVEQKNRREERVLEIKRILSGESNKKIICIGPCSADSEDAVVEYVERLAMIQEVVNEKMIIIPRVYTGKPRTNGMGYKGLVHRPNAECEYDDILAGIVAMRKMHFHVIQQTGMYCADEMLYPETLLYVLDLLAYVAVGARSVEDQGHRLLASGLSVPVGMKNPTSGNLNVLINSIVASRFPHSLFYNGWEVQTEGNKYTHAVLRGYTDYSGRMRSNYHYEYLQELYDLYSKNNLYNISVLIDCSHANSNKQYEEQIRIAKEVFGGCKYNKFLSEFIKGIMVESYLEDGSQIIGGGIFGKSITDGCLGWKKTERLLRDLYELI